MKKLTVLKCNMLMKMVLVLVTVATSTTLLEVRADVPRPRGVSLAKASLYAPRENNQWVCLNGKKTIRFLQINDDYCDCEDGSDEPGTSACTQGHFYCQNLGHRPVDIPSSRVNDGICDCCDASDEWNSQNVCSNTCKELGRVEQEQRRNQVELHKRGANKRGEMIAKGKQLKAEREVRRSELERRRLEQEALKTEKENLKRSAETVETEALELYKEQQRELEAVDAEKETKADPASNLEEHGVEAQRIEAESHFVRYDANQDGFVEVTELQVDMILDRDRNGVVTVEEAKYFLDMRDRIDLDGFLSLSWPRIKPMQMLAEGIFKPPTDETSSKEPEDVTKLPDQVPVPVPEPHTQETQSTFDINEQPEHEENEGTEEFEAEEEEETYEDEEDADVGIGTVVAESTPAPEYDPETQKLIDLANEARGAYNDVERELREIEHEIKEIDDQTGKDYGPLEEFASLDGECFKFEDREYVYMLCPFDRASQKQRSGGGSETTLGRWEQWVGEGVNKYAQQKYSHGASCWNGPQRSALVQLKCGMEDKVTAVSEPNRCEYHIDFETPAACGDVNYTHDQDLHDEL